jgi:hypothetical protein
MSGLADKTDRHSRPLRHRRAINDVEHTGRRSPEQGDSNTQDLAKQREVPKDEWGLMQRVYGIRHHLLWPSQFSLSDMFWHITLLCIGLSMLMTVIKLIQWLSH